MTPVVNYDWESRHGTLAPGLPGQLNMRGMTRMERRPVEESFQLKHFLRRWNLPSGTGIFGFPLSKLVALKIRLNRLPAHKTS
jgi:hypothetical protein